MGATAPENARVWSLPHLREVELLSAHYLRQHFSKHFHDCFAVGVIQAGALQFDYRGGSLLAAPGEINLCLAGEPHNGKPAHESGWRYRMLYLGNHWLRGACIGSAQAKTMGEPFFRSGVLKDPDLALELLSLHRCLEPGAAGALEQESRFLGFLRHLVERHCHPRPAEGRARSSARAVALAREYLADNLLRNPSLSEISRIAGLSRYHLLRVFSRQLGLTPHAFQIQLRLQKAKSLLRAGLPPAEAALASGFSDQSHLTRHFKRVYGFTPGQYRNSVQES
ncbi:hypothetical protein AAU61_10355 [Desulfocarbo indianensis]|nr:hypothetical protein AAU61_10355 [Desulfocarbo indianensis]